MGSRPRTPSSVPAPHAAQRPVGRRPGRNARRPTRGGSATRSGSSSTRTRRARGFFINDVGQNDWEEVDDGVAGADYGWNVREGPCVNASRTNCGAPPAGMTNPISLVLARRVQRDHGRRLRPERDLAGVVRRDLPVRRLHVREDLPADAERNGRVHTHRVRYGCGRRRQPRVRPGAGRAGAVGPGALLHELQRRGRGPADRVHGVDEPSADREHDRRPRGSAQPR